MRFVGLNIFREGWVSVISLFAYPNNNANANKAVFWAFGICLDIIYIIHQRWKNLETTLNAMRWVSWVISMKFFYRNYTTAPQNSLTSKHLLNYVCARAPEVFPLFLLFGVTTTSVCSRYCRQKLSVGLTTFNTNHEKFTRLGVCI